MLFLKNSMLFVIMTVLLLHAVVHHEHLENMSDREHQILNNEADDIIDYLAIAFNNDLAGNLENPSFLANDLYEKNTLLVQSFKLFVAVNLNHNGTIQQLASNPSYQYFFLSLFSTSKRPNGLRAPPISGFYA